jgi:hypothetical protein
MEEVTIPFERYEQEFPHYCGPAVGQMVLAALGVGMPPLPPSWQRRLWSEVQKRTGCTRPRAANKNADPCFPTQKCERVDGSWSCWSTTPVALRNVLNAKQRIAAFRIARNGCERSATDTLADTLDRTVPGIALVYGWQHWVALDGYTYDPPAPGEGARRHVTGVYLRNPSTGSVLHYVEWARWRDEYLTFVPAGLYKNEIITLSARRRRRRASRLVPQAGPDSRLSKTRRRVAPLNNETAVEEGKVAARYLLRSPRWQLALADAEVGKALFVERNDNDSKNYYIVPFVTRGRVTARLLLDVRTARFGEAVGVETRDGSLPPFVNPMNIANLESPSGCRLDRIQGAPRLTWEPCRESASALLPFYFIDEFYCPQFYLRADGKPFNGLTTGLA